MANDKTVALKNSLAAQHPLHGLFGEVFDELGNKDFLLAYAQKNPGRFLQMLVRLTPAPQSTSAIQGDLNITINEALRPTALDAVTLDEQGRIVDGK